MPKDLVSHSSSLSLELASQMALVSRRSNNLPMQPMSTSLGGRTGNSRTIMTSLWKPTQTAGVYIMSMEQSSAIRSKHLLAATFRGLREPQQNRSLIQPQATSPLSGKLTRRLTTPRSATSAQITTIRTGSTSRWREPTALFLMRVSSNTNTQRQS